MDKRFLGVPITFSHELQHVIPREKTYGRPLMPFFLSTRLFHTWTVCPTMLFMIYFIRVHRDNIAQWS